MVKKMAGFPSAISSLRLSKMYRRDNVPKFTIRSLGGFAIELRVITNTIGFSNGQWLVTWKNATEDFHDMIPPIITPPWGHHANEVATTNGNPL